VSQGDQIGRIFVQWAIVFFVQFYENPKSSQHFCQLFLFGNSYVSILTKLVLGYILGAFSTNSSGHPAVEHLYLGSRGRSD
jgi:hypothetical protein